MSAHESRRSDAIRTAAMVLEAVRQRHLPYASPETIRRVQERRIRRIVAYAHTHVPYYRETMRRLLLVPADLRTAEDLAQLPLINREQLQRDPQYFLSERWPPEACVRLESGGSTGEAITFFRDPPALFAQAAHYERLRAVIGQLSGRPLRHREAAIVPPDSSSAMSVSAFRARTRLPKDLRVRRRAFSMLRPPAELVPELSDYRPDVISSYGSYLDALFGHIREHRPAFRAPRVAVYGADSMSLAMRDWARGALGIEVLSTYGAVEAAHIGFECERHRGHHLNVDLYPVRLIRPDGREVDDQDTGEIVVSNLVNAATVLLNYRLGDEVGLSSEKCSCGRTLPLSSYLARTSAAWLDLGDGHTVHAQALKAVLRHEQQLWRYQIVQETPRRFLLRVVPSPECDRQTTAARIRERLQDQLPDGTGVRVEFVSDLPRGPSGKVQPILPLFPG